MAKKVQRPQNMQKEQKTSFLEKFFGSFGGAVTIILACLGAGFAFGKHYERIENEADMRKFENEQQIQIIEYRERIFELHKEVLDLKNENSKLQSTKNNNENEK